MRRSRYTQAGFTLLEILVAMAVFAVMAGMAYAGLRTVLDTRQATETRADTLAQWQRFVYILNDDLVQALPRSVRDEMGSEQAAFAGGNDDKLLTLTRGVADWSGQSAHAHVQRVEYRRESDGIYRQVWQVLDRTQQTRLRRRKLLAAEHFELRFYGSEWRSVWAATGAILPRALEASVQLPGIGAVRRVFTLRP